MTILVTMFAISIVTIILPVHMLDADAQPLSDATGLVNRFDVMRDNSTFEVSIVANFDVPDVQYDQEQQMLTLYIDSSLDNNVGEVVLPIKVLDGEITFELNGQSYTPTINSNDDIYFILLNFTGTGDNQLVVYGESNTQQSSTGGGCLVATAAYGTELGPEIQLLREIRDKNVQSTVSGAIFMSAFNHVYYAFSPTVADWERQYPTFREITKLVITPMIFSLHVLEHADTELELVALGMLTILTNIGMYAGLPIGAIIVYRKKIKRKQSLVGSFNLSGGSKLTNLTLNFRNNESCIKIYTKVQKYFPNKL